MRQYKVKTVVKESYSIENDHNLIMFEKGEEVILERSMYELLLSKGKVEEGEIIEEGE